MYKKYVLLILALHISGSEPCNNNVINENVERLIDLRSQLVKITSRITLRNDGQDPLANFLIYLEPTNGSLSYVFVKDAEENELQKTCDVSNDQDACSIKMNRPLGPLQKESFMFTSVYTRALQPHPKSIRQHDKQLILYFGNHYFYSPYQTEIQTTTVLLNSKNIESYTTATPHVIVNSTIKYGPFYNVEPLRFDQMVMHYESNAPFLSVTRLRRWIDVSHWGKIGVQEDIHLEHTGAKLISPFSRFDYQHGPVGVNHHYIKSYSTVLSTSAHDIYYRDGNGNISTSTVRKRKDYIELELRPRYPIFGGWKTTYTIGYKVQSRMYLFKDSAHQFVLRMPFVDHIIDDMHVAELETSIVLPFGARNIKVETPYELENLTNGTVYKYLDLLGHTTITIRKKNLVEEHIQNVDVRYDWRPYFLLYEPMLLIAFLFALFVVIIACVRIDFSIGTRDHVKLL